MKKCTVLLLSFVCLLIFTGCGDDVSKIITPVKLGDSKPVESLCNQYSQLHFTGSFAMEGHWIYRIVLPPSGQESLIVRSPLNDPENQETIYEGNDLNQISVLNGWIYFTERDGKTFYKMRIDGEEKQLLARNVGAYILTEKTIIYTGYGYWTHRIYSMNLDGSDRQVVLGKNHILLGVDNGWIYFYIDDDNHGINNGGPYRIKLDGTGNRQLIDSSLGVLDPFAINGDAVYFTRHSIEKDQAALVKKTINGTENVLFSFPSDNMVGLPINNDDECVYFGLGNDVYKVNMEGKAHKELIYRGRHPVVFIFLHEKDIVVGLSSGECIYIKQDGSRTKFTGLLLSY